MNDFGVTEEERRNYKPTEIAHQVRDFLENSYNDYKAVSALLAVAEEEVILYSPPLRKATCAVGIDVEVVVITMFMAFLKMRLPRQQMMIMKRFMVHFDAGLY